MKRNRKLRKSIHLLLVSLSLIFIANIPPAPEEGMFPLSEIRNLDLRSAGLKISIDEVYNPNGISIVDALVNVGGCTGSFVSPEGLIFTNHHCVFDAVQKASTTENNYLKDGFLAKTRNEEIIASGLTCRITDSYEDVSDLILKAADEAEDISKRSEAISKKIREIIREEEEKDPSIKAEVSEMFIGQSYVLFRYKTINDVRIVYAPPRSIGEFGGESDNWVWPRHTGDFAFLRAYVAPDGSPAKYSEENIPYSPKKYLKVNPNGAEEGDFVFLLGYPGRTFKHYPSHYIRYQQEYQLPYISGFFRWMINLYEEKGEADPEFALRISPRIKAYANVEKNYNGKLIGLERLNLVQKKIDEEKELQQFIESDPQLKEKYNEVLSEIEKVYAETLAKGRLPFIFTMLIRNVSAYNLANLLIDYASEIDKPSSERKSLFRDDNRLTMFLQIHDIYNEMNPEIDKRVLTKILYDAASFPEVNNVNPFNRFSGAALNKNIISEFVTNILENSIIYDREKYLELFDKTSDEIKNIDDPLLNFTREVYQTKQEEDKLTAVREGKLNILLAKLMDMKKLWMDKSFIPDANRTLRLTYGYVRGYSPADAVYYSPITTLRGLIEKGRDEGEYYLPKVIRELYNKKDFGRFKHPKLNDVPVAILYNTDTSGGNSGSPVLNAYGEVVGVNFDRSFEATINDFVWSEDYSRSIGVDIRYVLWVTQKVAGADFLLEELGVSLQ